MELKLLYTNHEGKVGIRTVVPWSVLWGSTPFHPEPQWILRVMDQDRKAFRDYALKDCNFAYEEDSSETKATGQEFRVPLTVRCIQEVSEAFQSRHPGVDFGTLGKQYSVNNVIPNGCYYVLRGAHMGELLGEPGSVNHLLNMDRFEVIEYMTENGIEGPA